MEAKDFIDINKSPSSSSSGSKNSSMAENVRLEDDDNLPTLTMDLFQKKTSVGKKKGGPRGKAVRWLMDFHRKDFGGAVGARGGGDAGFRRGPRRGVVNLSLDRFPSGVPRPASRLEESLIPGLKTDVRPSPPTFGEFPETAQMTIFYAGTINVYDHIPADKAYGIMVLASRCSVEPTNPMEQADVPTKLDLALKTVPSESHKSSNDPKDLPFARRYSLRRFLEKRRDRMSNKVPYTNLG